MSSYYHFPLIEKCLEKCLLPPQGWKNLVHVRVVHQMCTKHRLEGHGISCTNIIFHGNQYILLLHYVFMAINKIKITCFDLQAITASWLVQVPHLAFAHSEWLHIVHLNIVSKHQRLLCQNIKGYLGGDCTPYCFFKQPITASIYV